MMRLASASRLEVDVNIECLCIPVATCDLDNF